MKKRTMRKIGLIGGGALIGFASAMLIKRSKLFLQFKTDFNLLSDVSKEVKIFVANDDCTDIHAVAEQLHNQLRGNSDYVDCSIVLNDEEVINNGVNIGRMITYTVYKEAKDVKPLNLEV